MLKAWRYWASGAAALVTIAALILFAQSLWVPIPIDEQKACRQSAEETGNKQPDCRAYETVWERGLSDPTAYYTFWLTLFTGALAGFGVMQIALLVRAENLSRESSQRQLRAYVDVEHAVFDGPEGGNSPWFLDVTIKNYGQTPATPISVKIEKFIGPQRDGDVSFPFTAAVQESKPPRIPPGHTLALGMFCPELGHGMAIWQAKNAAGERAYVWGRIEFIDAFNDRFYLTFQMQTEFGNQRSLGWTKGGNGTGPLT